MERTPVPEQFAARPNGATEKQVAYIEGLLDQRDLLKSPRFWDAVNAMDKGELAHYILALKAQARTLSKADASKWIKALVALPYLPRSEQASAVSRATTGSSPQPVDVMRGRTRVEFIEVETDSGKPVKTGKIILADGRELIAGSYGIDTASDDRFTNDFSFFKVWVAEGYGKGWGVKLYVSDYTHRVKLAGHTQVDVVQMIADAGPLEAAKAFGHEFKRCGVCSRGLTNDESRDLGIGPVCGRRLGVR